MTLSELLLGLVEGTSMEEPVCMTQSTVRLEVNHDGSEESLLIRYVLHSLEPTRKNILLRRVFAILNEEEHRLWHLSDQKAIEELDALKAKLDTCFYSGTGS